MTSTTQKVTFSAKEKEDLHELFRIYDFAKVNKVNSIVEDLEAKQVTPEAYFSEMFKLYKIKSLPDREEAKIHLHEAVPDATDADVESVLRLTEMRRFAEKDALRSLERQFNVSRASRPPSRPVGSPPSAAAGLHARLSHHPTAPVARTPTPPPTPSRQELPPLMKAPPSPHRGSQNAVASRRSGGSAARSPAATPTKKQLAGQERAGEEKEDSDGRTDFPSLTSHPSELQEAISNLRGGTADANGSDERSDEMYSRNGADDCSFHRGPASQHHSATLGEGGKYMYGDLNRTMSQLSATYSRQVVDEVMAEEVREWVAKMIGDKYNEDVLAKPNFVDALRNGVVLQILLQKMNDPPVPDDKIKVPKRTTGFFARDSVTNFLVAAKKRYHLLDAQIFSNTDLCDGKDDRQVITCLMAMARIAYNQGSIKIAPSIVMIEKEIETHGAKLTAKEIDRIVQESERKEREGLVDTSTDDSMAAEKPTNSAEELKGGGCGCSTDGRQNKRMEDESQGVDDAAGRTLTATEEEAGTAVPPCTSNGGDAVPPAPDVEPIEGKDDDAIVTREPLEALAHSLPNTIEPISTEELQECNSSSSNRSPLALSRTVSETTAEVEQVDTEGLVGKRKEEWNSKIDEEQHVDDTPEPRTDVPKQKPTRVVWKVPRKDGSGVGQPPFYRSRRWDGIDVALGNTLNEYYKESPNTPWRFHAVAANSGEYVMYNRDTAQKKVVFVRFIQRKLFIRYSQGPAGPEWVVFTHAVKRLDDMFAKQQS